MLGLFQTANQKVIESSTQKHLVKEKIRIKIELKNFKKYFSFINKQGKHVQVDIYGDCGTLRCDAGVTKCSNMLEQDYKFYLAFENSYCDDYVTEKFFSILRLDVVPIVFGGSNYTSIAPPHSFIDASMFKSAGQLADYLKILDKDDSLYEEYFWWKPFYKIRDKDIDIQIAFCGLCARLHYDTTTKVYDNLENWWVSQSHCKKNRPNSVFRIPFWK